MIIFNENQDRFTVLSGNGIVEVEKGIETHFNGKTQQPHKIICNGLCVASYSDYEIARFTLVYMAREFKRGKKMFTPMNEITMKQLREAWLRDEL